jgi:hypothetical protein
MAAACFTLSTSALAQGQPSESSSFEEIVVTADTPHDDRTRIAPDAEFLLRTAGDGNDPLKALLGLP